MIIPPGTMLYDEPVEAEGLLLIGDPEVASSRPGRRKDPDWPGPILRKLERCVEVANHRRLVPLFLGDVFEHPHERDEALKTRLIQILKRFWMPPVTNVGNHDMANKRLSIGDTLYMMAACDVLDAPVEGGPVMTVRMGGRLTGIGMTPHGQDIPTDVTGLLPGADVTVWLTHHDVHLQESFPGAVRPHEILGCRLVVNGHIHAYKVPERVGQTRWENPGTVNRSTIDLIDHVPRAWVLNPTGPLEPVDLPHDQDVFDLTGLMVDAATTAEVARSVESAFVSLLQAQSIGEMERSDDGSLLREALDAKYAAERTPQDVRAIVDSLWREATGEAA